MLDWLKTILGEAYSEEIDKKVSDEIGKAFVSRSDFNALNETKKTLEGTIETLKNQNGDNQELQNTIKKHEAEIARLQKEKTDADKTYALRDAMREKGVMDPDYVIFKQGGVDKFAFDKDGKPEKLDDTLKPYRENAATAHLFAESSQHYSPNGGSTPVKNPFAKETYNLTEQGKLLRDNPAQAKEMAAAAGVTLNL